jgi:hypothetical protein
METVSGSDIEPSDSIVDLNVEGPPTSDHLTGDHELDEADLQYENTHGGALTTDVGLTSAEMPMHVDTDPGALLNEKTRPRPPDTDPGSRA